MVLEDLLNWQALLIEIAIAIPFAVYIYKRQDKLQKAQSEIIQKLNDIISKEDERHKKRKVYLIMNAVNDFDSIKQTSNVITNLIDDFLKNKSEQNKMRVVSLIKEIGVVVSLQIAQLKRKIDFVIDLLDNPQLAINISQIVDIFPRVFDSLLEDSFWQIDLNLQLKIQAIDTLLKTFEGFKSELLKEIEKRE